MMGNSLSAHHLETTSLASHAMVRQRLADGTLIAGDVEGLEGSKATRSLLSYIVRCALRPGDVLMVSHEGHAFQFPGQLGLAAAWEARGLTIDEMEKVSGCLIAHVNAFRTPVQLSGRMVGSLGADEAERAGYRGYEGTFFGRAFITPSEDESIALYACQGDDAEIARAHAPIDRRKRRCTDGHDDCGAIVALGRCREVCDSYVDEYGWTDCRGGGVRHRHTFSAFLADENPDSGDIACGAGASCTARDALVTETARAGTRAILSCRDSVDCDATCSAGDRCTLDGANATGEFRARVERGALARVAAYNASAAQVRCDGPGTRCEIDCKSAGACRAGCTSGASCVLECAGAESCGFIDCHESGGAALCGDDVRVCGAACP